MNQNTKSLIIIILSLVLGFGMISLLFIVKDVDKKTEHNTIEYRATVSSVEITDIGKNKYIEIFVKEFNTSLTLNVEVAKYIDTKLLRDLKKGETIIFRVENYKAELNGTGIVDVVSLKTADVEILSLEEYNSYMEESSHPVKFVLVTLILIFGGISLYNGLKIRKK